MQKKKEGQKKKGSPTRDAPEHGYSIHSPGTKANATFAIFQASRQPLPSRCTRLCARGLDIVIRN